MSPQPISFWQRMDQHLGKTINIVALTNFFRLNKNLLIWLAIVGVVAYGYDLFSFALKIDSENHSFGYGPHGTAWVSQGRWGMYLLSWLFLPDVVMPFIPTLIGVTGLGLAALFFVHLLSAKRSFADYLAGAIAISCPVLYFAIYFTTLGYGIGVAFLVSCLGVYLLDKAGMAAKVAAVGCFTLGFGIYQATLPLIACLFCLQQTSAIIDARLTTIKTLLQRLFFFIVIVATALILNQMITQLLLKGMQLTFQSEYIMGFISFRNDPAYWKETALVTLEKTWGYYTGDADYYLYDLFLLKVLFVIAVLVSLVRIFSSPTSIALRILGLLLLLSAIIAPLMMHMLNSGTMPPRSVLGVSFVLAGLVYFAASSSVFMVRSLITLLALSCFYNFSMVNNRYAFSNEMTWEADRTLSTLLLKDIQAASNHLPPKTDPWAKLPIEIVGWHEYFESPIFVHREVIGASFYTWGAGDADRIVKVFSAMGLTDYRNATREERLSVIETAQTMPAWPYQGSVTVVNGIIVIKLREYNPHQLAQICAPPLDTDPVCLKYKPAL